MGGEEHVVDLHGGADEEAGEREQGQAQTAGQGRRYEGLKAVSITGLSHR